MTTTSPIATPNSASFHSTTSTTTITSTSTLPSTTSTSKTTSGTLAAADSSAKPNGADRVRGGLGQGGMLVGVLSGIAVMALL